MARKKYFPIFFLLLYLLFIFYNFVYPEFQLDTVLQSGFFWSYAAWAQGKRGHGREILLNIALFVPLGYFLAAVLDGGAVKRFGLMAAGLSLIISVAIEGIQYVDGLGLTEWDDVFNNVLGACLGIGVYALLEKLSSVTIPYVIEERRSGDIAVCYSDPGKAKKELGWKGGVRYLRHVP